MQSMNFPEMSDLELLMRSRECKQATSELLTRYFPWTSRVITLEGRGKGLHHQEIDDACQDAVFAILKAIRNFDIHQLATPDACSFQSFLRRVVVTRFIDFLRRRQRYANHIRMLSQMVSEDQRTEIDPARQTQSKEIENRVSRFINDLAQPERNFMNELRRGNSLRTAAESVGISYDKAKRLRRKLKPKLLVFFE